MDARGRCESTCKAFPAYPECYEKMATPIKRTVNITFSNVNTCVACNESHRQKYFIVKKDKTKGPAFDIVAYYYNTPPSLDGNVAMFLCCPCFKLLNRSALRILSLILCKTHLILYLCWFLIQLEEYWNTKLVDP